MGLLPSSSFTSVVAGKKNCAKKKRLASDWPINVHFHIEFPDISSVSWELMRGAKYDGIQWNS